MRRGFCGGAVPFVFLALGALERHAPFRAHKGALKREQIVLEALPLLMPKHPTGSFNITDAVETEIPEIVTTFTPTCQQPDRIEHR